MNLSIGTLSKAFGLSDEALRFYEKKGLLHPVRQRGNGYRVFEMADIQRISNIQRLKGQGFALEEIQRIYEDCDEAALAALYREKIEQMQRKISFYNHVMDRMRASATALEEAPARLLVPAPISLGRVCLLEYPSVPHLWRALPDDPLLQTLMAAMPLTAYTTIIGRDSLGSGVLRMTKGILFAEEHAADIGTDPSCFRIIDAACAVGCLFRLEDGNFDAADLCGRLNAYIRGHGLRAADDLFTQQLSSYMDGGRAIHYARLIVPVAPDGG